ncbi:MAG: MaoC/PaaZ C-terminal domain-containing protein [Steroidobacteraceae bacterium]|jgi:acyl dehydratase|nr:MaoC/PaaZ C-terminal domain-containing protein [Steroidobacteraceae bacterium]
MSAVRNLLASEVREGQELPPLHFRMTATAIVLGALASRDWRPMHHDKDFAVERNGVKNIFMNTPNVAAWFERYLTDWTGPKGRLGRLTFKMKKSVFPGDDITFSGRVTRVSTDQAGCCWVEVDLAVAAGDELRFEGRAKLALPDSDADNPWARKGPAWRP